MISCSGEAVTSTIACLNVELATRVGRRMLLATVDRLPWLGLAQLIKGLATRGARHPVRVLALCSEASAAFWLA